ncbi:MAG: PilZ domain-containing protein [Acidobacteria bacterium]|nr:PilZ domain-containing protein [Acidobacteriota bacterium]
MNDDNALSPVLPIKRLTPIVPVRVEWRASADRKCVEITRLLSVNPRSATFTLSERLKLGQLLHLTLPDGYTSEQRTPGKGRNRTWSVIWALSSSPDKAEATSPATLSHAVSVVFVGEDVPVSFDKTQAASYSYVAEEDGHFRLQKESAAPSATLPHMPARRESRIYVPMEVTVEALDESGVATAREQTVTENISRRGAAVWTTLALEMGDHVQVTSACGQISIKAVVRARRVGSDGIARLHIEFLNGLWPLEGLR